MDKAPKVTYTPSEAALKSENAVFWAEACLPPLVLAPHVAAILACTKWRNGSFCGLDCHLGHLGLFKKDLKYEISDKALTISNPHGVYMAQDFENAYRVPPNSISIPFQAITNVTKFYSGAFENDGMFPFCGTPCCFGRHESILVWLAPHKVRSQLFPTFHLKHFVVPFPIHVSHDSGFAEELARRWVNYASSYQFFDDFPQASDSEGCCAPVRISFLGSIPLLPNFSTLVPVAVEEYLVAENAVTRADYSQFARIVFLQKLDSEKLMALSLQELFEMFSSLSIFARILIFFTVKRGLKREMFSLAELDAIRGLLYKGTSHDGDSPDLAYDPEKKCVVVASQPSKLNESFPLLSRDSSSEIEPPQQRLPAISSDISIPSPPDYSSSERCLRIGCCIGTLGLSSLFNLCMLS